MTSATKSAPTILLVDDEEVIRMMGRDILRVLGYEVMTASHGQETLEIYNANKDKISDPNLIQPGTKLFIPRP